MLLWRAARGTLPVGTNLCRRKVTPNASCVRCGADESETHLMFHCPFARETWSKAPLQTPLNVDTITDVKSGISICNSKQRSTTPSPSKTVSAPWIIWALWSSRNRKIFDRRSITAEETVQMALIAEEDWQNAQMIEPPTTQPPRRSATSSTYRQEGAQEGTTPGTIICQTDAAWLEQSRNAGLGWVVLNCDRSVRARHCKPCSFVKGPSEAEALCIYEALIALQDQQSSPIILESDAKTVIMAINSRKAPLNIKGIIEDILFIAKSFRSISFRFLPRSQNSIADDLAKTAIRSMTSGPPLSL